MHISSRSTAYWQNPETPDKMNNLLPETPFPIPASSRDDRRICNQYVSGSSDNTSNHHGINKILPPFDHNSAYGEYKKSSLRPQPSGTQTTCPKRRGLFYIIRNPAKKADPVGINIILYTVFANCFTVLVQFFLIFFYD